MTIKKAAVVLLACLLLAGCSAAPDNPAPTPTVSTVVTPSSGQPLTAWGFTHEPADLIWLPGSVSLTYTADQPNLLIAAGTAAQADLVQSYLRTTLPGLGWRITADAAGGLLFEQGEWRGAYALGSNSWALTVRND